MSVALEAIRFNHDPGSSSTSALNLRRNGATFDDGPEWVPGRAAGDSVAAYAAAAVAGADPAHPNVLLVRATFRRLDATVQSVRVRALDPTPQAPPPMGCAGAVAWLVLGLLRSPFRAVHVLGDIPETLITFPQGQDTIDVLLPLPGASVTRVGVRTDTIAWRWEVQRTPVEAWTEITTTAHRIFTLLDVPKAPWTQLPFAATNTQLPWIDVLEHACSWAHLSGDLDTAAGRVTDAVYGLGPALVEYDCPNRGMSHYTYPDLGGGTFRCTEFLERLRGGVGCGRYVNCTDCATIVTTFSNVLGCELWSSRMHHPEWSTLDDPDDRSRAFALNPIVAIGTNAWDRACGWGNFRYHEVAWKGGCTEDDAVFDACLKLDEDGDPTAAPHLAALAKNLRFGRQGEGQYRDRLAAPGPEGRERCQPRPLERTRLWIG